MRRICLSLPTNRECAAAIASLAEEAAYAVRHFDVEVYLLILDTSKNDALTENSKAVKRIPGIKNVIPLHLSENEQRQCLREIIDCANVDEPDFILDLMLPDGVSYGACTNRIFLISSALGCESVHRRDSDSRYQVVNGDKAFPIHHELMSLGKRAAEAKVRVSEVSLDPAHDDQPVSMVGSSFIGELSVDIGEIRALDEEVYRDIVSLWAASGCSSAAKRELVEVSFKGAGTARFVQDRSTLTVVDPMTVDMCNIGFYQVYEQIPLPPATDTIGSDYFLMHVVYDAKLPGVQHNRNIENFYTCERRTDAGFIDYQMRFTKFFLSMLYFHFIYGKMAQAGRSLLDGNHRLLTPKILDMVQESTRLEKTENEHRLNVIDRAYRKLGGRYAQFADILAGKRRKLLEEAERDIHNFALLIELWAPLMKASKTVGLRGRLRCAS
jgi:hypothetical protein